MAEFFSMIRRDHFIPVHPPDVIGGYNSEQSSFYEDQYLKSLAVMEPHKPMDLRAGDRISVLAVVPRTLAGEPDPCAHIRVLLPLSHQDLRDRVTMRLVSERQALRYQADLLIVQRTAISTEQSAEQLLSHCRLGVVSKQSLKLMTICSILPALILNGNITKRLPGLLGALW